MPHTLLLADDSVTIQKVVGITLASEDVELVTVDNGEDALVRAREIHPDAVLADLNMPGLNGYELCRAIRNDPELARTPVLLLTGSFESFDESLAKKVGANAHIAKPFEAQALVDAVRRLLEGACPIPEVEPPAAAHAEVLAERPAPERPPRPEPARPVGLDLPDKPAESDFSFEDLDFSAPAPASQERTMLMEKAPLAAEPTDPATVPSATADALEEVNEIADSLAFQAQPLPPAEDSSTAPLASGEGDEIGDALYDDLAFIDPLEESPSEDTAPSAMVPAADPESVDPDLPSDVTPLSARRSEEESEILGDAPVANPAGSAGPDDTTAAGARTPELGDPPPESDTGNLLFAEPLPPEGSTQLQRSPGQTLSLEDSLPELTLEDAVVEERAEEPPAFSAPLMAEPPLEPDDALAEHAELAPEPESAGPLALDPPAHEPAHTFDPPPTAEPLSEEARPALDPERSPDPNDSAVAIATTPDVARSALAMDQGAVREALEKVAWEAFGPLSEQLVREVVAKVESVAWEIIPELAERLIRDELDRMKSNS